MRSLIAISTLIITFSINAKELQVQDLNLIYKLSFDQNHIRYEAQEISLSLVHQKCSEHIIKRFNEKMDFILKMPEIKIQNENTWPYNQPFYFIINLSFSKFHKLLN